MRIFSLKNLFNTASVSVLDHCIPIWKEEDIFMRIQDFISQKTRLQKTWFQPIALPPMPVNTIADFVPAAPPPLIVFMAGNDPSDPFRKKTLLEEILKYGPVI